MEVQARSMGVGRRDMTVAGVSGSQYLVSTDNQPGNFIDLLRNDSVVLSMGATRLTGLVGNITIPKMTAGGTAYWLADENTQITESQATIGQLSLSPKNVAALTEISHQLMSQSSPDVETMVMNDLAQVLALAIDVAAIRGTGNTGQPQGIVGTSGVGTFDTDSTDSFGDVVGAQVDVMAANALRDGCAYVADPASAALLMSRSRFANTDTPVWSGSLLGGTMAGFPCRATNQMSANTMLFGLWPSVVVAEWGQLELMVNPYSDFTRGLSAVRAWYAIDTGMRYPAAFSYDATVA
jgi:HK97 family phage major capsid protein